MESKDKSDDNIVYVGGKDRHVYLLAIQTQFGRSNEVILKARGKNIGNAVDIAEMAKRILSSLNIEIEDILTGTTSQENPEKPDRPFLVSEIAITLKKK